MNIRKVIETYTQKTYNKLPGKNNMEELEKKFKNLLLTNENKVKNEK